MIPLTGKEAATRLYNGEPRLMYYDDDQSRSAESVGRVGRVGRAESVSLARALRDFMTS